MSRLQLLGNVLSGFVFLVAMLVSFFEPVARATRSVADLALLPLLISGTSFSLAPLFSRSQSILPRGKKGPWVSLSLYLLGSSLLIGVEIATPDKYGLEFYLGHFGSGARYVWIQTWGLAAIALAVGLQGNQWFAMCRRCEEPNPWRPLLIHLGIAGFVQMALTPVALGIAVSMTLERFSGIRVFLPSLGGDASLLPTVVWLYLQPTMLVAAVPAFGLVESLASGPNSAGHQTALSARRRGAVLGTFAVLIWGFRPEVVLSAPMRGFFSFVGLAFLLLFGHALVITLARTSRTDAVAARSFVGVFGLTVLLVGSVSLIPALMPSASSRMSSAFFLNAHAYLCATAIVALLAWLGLLVLRNRPLLPGSLAGFIEAVEEEAVLE